MTLITLTLPDGKSLKAEHGLSGIEIIKKHLGEGLGRAALAVAINGVAQDVYLPVTQSGTFKVLTFNDLEGLEIFRHSSAHLLAHAVTELFPETKPTIGPVVEEGFYYDFDHPPFTQEDLAMIDKRMQEIVGRNLQVRRVELSRTEAKDLFKKNPYKIELIDETLREEVISAYQQGDFIDLCRGPHVPNTGMLKAVKITKLAGAYWRGDSKNKQLQRIYAISFPEKKLLQEYLEQRERAEKSDHRRLGRELDLFSVHDLSPGSVFFHPKGTIIYTELVNFVREEYRKRGYQEVITPNIFHKSLWEKSGHWEHYRNNMFLTEVEGQTFALKPMNCPSHILIYKNTIRSYRELPLRLADFGALHRNELSGTLSGLTRVRRLCQDDAHIFVAPEMIQNEIENLIGFVKDIYSTFGFEYVVELSTKPEKAIGALELWEKAEAALQEALVKKAIQFKLNQGDGAFYGPKIDFHIKDALGRKWQCATIQLDFNLPERFDATYEGKDGRKHQVVMIHRAILGSLERFIGVLIEHFSGKFPLWLSPVQVILLPITDRHVGYCAELRQKLFDLGIRVEVDGTVESMNKKIRNAQLQKIPLMVTVGDAEVEKKTLAVRTLDGTIKMGISVDDFVRMLRENIRTRAITVKV